MKRPKEITKQFLMELEKHMIDLKSGKAETTFEVQDMAEKKGCSASQLVLSWVLHQGNDILPLFGTTKQSSLQENIKAIEIQLTAGELNTINEIFPEGAFVGTRYAAPQMGMVVN